MFKKVWMRRQVRSAFTLVELLVVISIIALLVSMLMPSLAKAKDLARGVKCSVNMRNIGLGVLVYAQENNNYLPRASMTASMKPPKEPFQVRPWGEAIVPYLGHGGRDFSRFDQSAGEMFRKLFTGLYRCPSDKTHITENWVYNPSQLYLGHWSYGKNVIFEYNENWSPKYADFSKLDNIRKPDEIVLFGEIKANQMSDHLMVDAWLPDGSNATVDSTRHGATSNYIFCDTHVVPGKFKNMFDPPRNVNRFDPNWVPAPCP